MSVPNTRTNLLKAEWRSLHSKRWLLPTK